MTTVIRPSMEFVAFMLMNPGGFFSIFLSSKCNFIIVCTVETCNGSRGRNGAITT